MILFYKILQIFRLKNLVVICHYSPYRASLVGQVVTNLPAMQETLI